MKVKEVDTQQGADSITRDNPPLSRKEFLLRAGLAGASLVLSEEIFRRLLLYTPSLNPVSKPAGDYLLYPGWMEANVESPFIQPNKGHFNWLREAVFKNSPITELTKDFINYLKRNQQLDKRVLLGEALSYSIDESRSRLDEVSDDAIHPSTNRSLEAVHTGVAVLAAGFNTWFSFTDLKALGAPIDGFRSVTEYFWNSERGLAVQVFPRLFGLDEARAKDISTKSGEETRSSGEDRAIHFAQHLLIGFEHLYSKRFNLGEHTSIPFILKCLMFLGKNEEDRTRILSDTTGVLYEVSNLGSLKNWPIPFIRGVNEIGEGPFDPTVEQDYQGNHLGVETAIALWRLLIQEKPITPILDELNDPKFSDYKTPPILLSASS